VVQWRQGSGLYGPYSRDSPSTKCIAAQPPSPHAHQAPNIAIGIIEHSFRWSAGLCCSGNKGLVYIDPIRETHPSTKCIAAQPPSPHAHQAPYLATGTLEHSFRWSAGLWRSGNKGRTHVDLLERFAIHEMYSSPSTLAACTPSPVSCYWHPRAQLYVVGWAVAQWKHGADPCGPTREIHHPRNV
jgi:hypothetical protein